MKPTACVVHNNVDDSSAIGRLARWSVELLLSNGYEVTVVARDLAPHLETEVTWNRLYVPPRLHLVQWLAARRTIVSAMGAGPYDLRLVHQPQVAALADVWHCHFLSRANQTSGGLAEGRGLKSRVVRGQQRGVVRAEDRYLERLPSDSCVAFVSTLLERLFTELYGPPPFRSLVLNNPTPEPQLPSIDARGAARRELLGVDPQGPLLAFLGGCDPRKGFRQAVDLALDIPGAHLVFAGPGSAGFADDRLGERLTVLGHLQPDEVRRVLTAADVLLVPSLFDPNPLVVGEAAAFGVPSVVSSMVGTAEDLVRFGAGTVMSAPAASSEPLREVLASLERFRSGAVAMAEARTEAVEAAAWMDVYESCRRRNRAMR